ncbi:MAG: ABC transporter substrate-binding protein, partial [Chloroflexota bacterium]
MLKTKKMSLLISLFLVLTLLTSACAGATQEVVGEPAQEEAAEEAAEEGEGEEAADEGEEAATEEGDVIKIGALAPLSAPGTVVGGEAMRDAMMIAESDINARGGILGKQVEIIIEDSEGLPERGMAVMEKLINQDGVVAVGGGYHSSVGVASKEVAADNNVPVVFAETWNDTITSSMLDQIFR